MAQTFSEQIVNSVGTGKDPTNLDVLEAITTTAAELNYLDITTLGTGAASKAVVLDAGEDYTWPATGVLTYGVLKDPAATTITATGAEINYLDITTLGTGAASKAVVLDAGEDYTWPATGILTYGVLKDPAATTITATGAEINKLDDSAVVMTKGSGVAGMETYLSGVFQNGTVKKTQVVIDLTGLVGSATDVDIIGDSAAANAHIGQITAALNGTIVAGQVTCLEVPAGGSTDVDFYSSTDGTGAQDADASGLAGAAALVTAGGAWASGTVKGMTALPGANHYIYVANGAGAAGGTFSAGKFLIEFYGS